MTSLIFSLFSILLVSAGALVVIVFNSAPTTNFSLVNFGFYALCFLFVYSLLSLIKIFWSRKKNFNRHKLINRPLLIITLFIVGSIVMSSMQVLNAVSIISFALSLLLLELFFISRNHSNDQRL
jgi:hypothetical protein